MDKVWYDYNLRVEDLKMWLGFCAKETITKMKRQPTECVKLFANYMTNKGLLSKIYKQFIQFNVKEKTWWKMGRRSELTFLQN